MLLEEPRWLRLLHKLRIQKGDDTGELCCSARCPSSATCPDVTGPSNSESQQNCPQVDRRPAKPHNISGLTRIMCGCAVLVEVATLGQGRLGIRAQRTNNGGLILPQVLGRSARRERSDVAPMPTGGHPSCFRRSQHHIGRSRRAFVAACIGNVREGHEKVRSPNGMRGHVSQLLGCQWPSCMSCSAFATALPACMPRAAHTPL